MEKSRGKVLLPIVIAMLLFALAACNQGGDAGGASANDESAAGDANASDFAGRELIFGVWGGSSAEAALKAYKEPFEALTGANIILEEYGDDVTAKVIAQTEQGLEGYDIISGCGILDQINVMQQRDALLPIDYSLLPNAEHLLPNAKGEYAIGQYVISTNLAWNKDVYGDDPPDTLAKFYDPEHYPGARAMIAFSPTGILEQALIADGVSKDELYPIDVDRAFKVLDKIKPSVTKWWSSGAEIKQALADGEVDCGIFWGGSVIESIVKDGNANIEIAHDDAFLIVDCLAITAACKDKELAHAFLNYCISGEAEGVFTEIKFYGPSSTLASDFISEDLLSYVTAAPQNMEKAFWCDVPYWQENFESNAERYMTWIAN
ncbi:MAG: extracellular solute-binding protein [Clostridiales Family XIII bacterium]|nr:extracellular solute-binding protein [Clostridiales Family XIII bacterium]